MKRVGIALIVTGLGLGGMIADGFSSEAAKCKEGMTDPQHRGYYQRRLKDTKHELGAVGCMAGTMVLAGGGIAATSYLRERKNYENKE